MAYTTKSIQSNLGTKLVYINAITGTALTNVTSASGIVYMVEIDATAGAATTAEPACYIKLVDATNATGGSTQPELVLYAPIGKKTCYIISEGWSFSNGLSLWGVTSAANNSSTRPTSDVCIKIITT